MSVGRICVREVDVADADENVWNAAERMHQRSVGTLVVIDEVMRPVGIVTDRDLVVRVLAANRDPGETPIRDVMTEDPRTIPEDAPIESALSAMRRGPFRRLPVVNADGQLVGLVSLDDILSILAEEFALIGSLLERETPRGALVGSSKY